MHSTNSKLLACDAMDTLMLLAIPVIYQPQAILEYIFHSNKQNTISDIRL